MDLFTTTSSASRRTASCVIAGIYENGRLGEAAADIDAATKGSLGRLVRQHDVSGKTGATRMLNDVPGVRARRVLVVGLGEHGKYDVAAYRQAMSAAALAIKDTKIRDAVSYLGLEAADGGDAYYLARYAIETIGGALYGYAHTKSGRRPPTPALRRVGLAVASRGDAARALRGAEHAAAIVSGMTLARDLGNLPANVCTPAYLAREARKVGQQYKSVTTRILNEPEIRKLGMGAFLSVTSGTTLPARLIVMQYKGAGREKPIVLIGKGITFDAGGISLKPGPGMDEMKFDMCGAAAVMGTLAAVARLKLRVNLTVIIPSCENLPGGSATRPGDIVTSMSGQTIEILNTDAEGRLLLCDAITYSRRFKPEVVIDVATLTGACVIALGRHLTAVMSGSDALAREITEAGVAADDRGWHMPMADDYAQQLKSNFADFANVGSREGGAITAACFLGKFADGLDWAHLDIAGTAWRSGTAKGSTGRPVPMLTEFVLRRAGAIG